MKPDEAKSIHAMLADFVFSAGLPFTTVEHPKFKLFVKRLRPTYEPPTRKTIANKYLDAQYENLKDVFSNKLAKAKSTKKKLRFTLVTDGWTNTWQEPIINYILVDPVGKAYFHSSNATGSAAHNADFLASELLHIIKEVGPEHINAICTDTASNMLAAAKIVVSSHEHIYPIKCALHSVNLLIQDILKINVLADTIKKMTMMVKWFKYQHAPYSELQSKQKHLLGKTVALSLPVVTRWHSNLNCMNSLLTSKDSLKSVILEPSVKAALLNSNKSNRYGKEVFALVEDPAFWSNLLMAKEIVEPFVQVIIGMEKNAPQLLKIYGSYSWLLSVIQGKIPELFKEQIMKIVLD